MQPSFERARRRPEGEITSAAEVTHHLHSLSSGRSFLSFLVFDHLVSPSVSGVHVVSSVQLLIFFEIEFCQMTSRELHQNASSCNFLSHGRARFQRHCDFDRLL